MMQILILEDEPLAAERLAAMLREYDPGLDNIPVVPSVAKALAWLEIHGEPSLIFSDIQVADGLCFDLFRKRPLDCPVIFTTAYGQYALDAFEVNSVQYLLKPVKYLDLAASLDKLKKMGDAFGKMARPNPELLEQSLQREVTPYKSRFLVRSGTKIQTVKTEEIAYFFSEDKTNFLIAAGQQKFPVDYSLDEISQMVDPAFFFRANRKYLIHIESVKEIHPYFKGRLLLRLSPGAGEDVVISADKTPAFKAWLDQ